MPVGTYNSTAAVKNILEVPQKPQLPYDPAVFTCRYILKRIKNMFIHKLIQRLIAAIFIMAKKRKLPHYPLTDEWMNKLRHNITQQDVTPPYKQVKF